MIKRVLLINSDLAKNRGDRAIAEGIIQLIKEHLPDAEITGLSEQASRDKDWFKISFLNMDSQSLSPLDLIRLLKFARKADIILWGGGEILKDYTNKLALWYWAIKVLLISLVNKELYGIFQGIGPTSSSFSKRLISHTVARCRLFIVRDDESRQKLVDWGASEEKIISSSDPAVVPTGLTLSKDTRHKLLMTHDISARFLGNFICIGPRSWFHYKTGGLVPFKYKKALANLFGRQIAIDPRYQKYLDQLVEMVDLIVESQKHNVLLVPMHMVESDSELCEYIRLNSRYPESLRILSEDIFSPSEVRSIMAKAKAMIGFRLHSNIVATSSNVPSINIYYVDKGRVFFEQIKQSHYSLPIERVLEDSFLDDLLNLLDQLIHEHADVQAEILANVEGLRENVQDAFNKIVIAAKL